MPTEHQGPPEEPTAVEDRERPQEPTAADEPALRDEPAPPGEAGPPGAAPRRRGRTVPLVAAAAALGLIAGACAGVLVQAGREPTPLPSLSQPELARAGGDAPARLPAAQDRRVRTDGDLRELLLKKPRGAREAEWLEDFDGWMDVASYAADYGRPAEKFSQQIHDGFRRAAVTGWDVGDSYSVEIRLVQFWEEDVLAAAEASEDARHWASWGADADIGTIPGTGDGEAFAHRLPETGWGGAPVYMAEAYAWRGDIAVQIWMTGKKRIGKKAITDVAERQMERL
ncbi:hypothetical protein [Streptomyces sp. NPDC004783]|uniref:hypothetical protein n=1 Tax=Streptomyces sp. NPDC004783 TaxID=3154459 RepID=UPI0033A57A70